MLPFRPFHSVRDPEWGGAEELLEDDVQLVWKEHDPFRV